eukprot:4377653-Amphidinium_carterae.1
MMSRAPLMQKSLRSGILNDMHLPLLSKRVFRPSSEHYFVEDGALQAMCFLREEALAEEETSEGGSSTDTSEEETEDAEQDESEEAADEKEAIACTHTFIMSS